MVAGKPDWGTKACCDHRSPGGGDDVGKGGNLRESAGLVRIGGVDLDGYVGYDG